MNSLDIQERKFPSRTRIGWGPLWRGLAILALSGCGGGGGSTTPAPTSTTPVLSPTPIALTSATVLGAKFWSDGSTATGGNGSAAMGGVNCLVSENYHIHSHLDIFKNGQALSLPAQIGLQGCAYELHTHDTSGIIHVETAAVSRFRLGQFFAVWGQPLSSTNVAGITGLPVVAYVTNGGVMTPYTGNLSDIELTSHESITIQIGTPLLEIPSYTWDPGL